MCILGFGDIHIDAFFQNSSRQDKFTRIKRAEICPVWYDDGMSVLMKKTCFLKKNANEVMCKSFSEITRSA